MSNQTLQFKWSYLNDLQDADEHWRLIEDYYVYEFYYFADQLIDPDLTAHSSFNNPNT